MLTSRIHATLVALSVAGCVAFSLGPAPALAKSPSPTKKKRRGITKARKRPKQGMKASADAGVVHALAWLRAEMAKSAKAGKPSELASLLLGGILENAFTQALHSHYALAGLGKALHKGAMERTTVQAMAQDMARNLRQGERTFRALAGAKALGQLAGMFGALAKLSVDGGAAATALATWAGKADGSALPFDQALEAYRVGVQAFAQQVRGGARAPTPPGKPAQAGSAGKKRP